MKSESETCSVVSDFLRPHGLYSPWNSLGQNIGVGSLSLLQGSNPGLPQCKQILYQLSYQGSPSRQEYWSGLPFPYPGDLPDPGIEPGSLAL